jgi:hypothetical protein
VIEVPVNRLRGKLDRGFERSAIQTIRGAALLWSFVRTHFQTLRFRLTTGG